MRKAAGIIMLVPGILFVAMWLIVHIQLDFGATVQAWILLALSVLVVAAGISVLRRRAYWWALLAAIGMVVAGATSAVGIWQDPFYRHHIDTATRVLHAASIWTPWGVPGILALIFLVKRKGEFERTEVKVAAAREE
ncbi:MAG: hypothetical protein IBX67_07760 [Dehalococcoidia bacterium]|nr:hypothetical protein [Dehalococcoidia bacterium]